MSGPCTYTRRVLWRCQTCGNESWGDPNGVAPCGHSQLTCPPHAQAECWRCDTCDTDYDSEEEARDCRCIELDQWASYLNEVGG
jgi:hypothetical protein